MKESLYRRKEKNIIASLVDLSKYSQCETKGDFVKLLKMEIEKLQSEEDSLMAVNVNELGDLGLRKSLFTFAKKNLQNLAKAIEDSGERRRELEEELSRVRSSLEEIEKGNQNRSVLDDTGK
jgi:predicted  nucleic acid-binding Zn-ribbon protein